MPGRAPETHDVSPDRSRWWQAAAVVVTALLFARTVGYGWVYDDQLEIVRNAYAHSLKNLGLIFTTTVWAGSDFETYLYRPLAVFTYALNHAVSGLAPWSYHLVNVVLHGAVSVMVFRLARTWRLSLPVAGVAALLFAAHPAHVEVVANVAGRKDLLAALFVVGMALAHRRALEGGAARALLPVGLYAAAMLSKEVGVVGMALVAAQDAYLEEEWRPFAARWRVRFQYAFYATALVLFLAARSAVTGGVTVPQTFPFDNPLVSVGPMAGLATAAVVVGKGVLLLLAPLSLSPDYSFDAIPVVATPFDARLWLVVAGGCAVVWALATGRARGTVIPMALAWYGLAVLPTANILVRVGTIFGERLLYLPSVGFCVALAAGLGWLLTRRPWMGRGAVALLLLGLCLQTWRYTGAWTDDISLFRWATASEPRSTKAHHKLGEELLRAGFLGDAIASLDRALDIAPDNEFAEATMAQARAEVVRRYVGVGGAPAQEPPENAEILYVLGQLSRQRGDLAGAEDLWRRALDVDPGHGASLGDLGVLSLTRADTAQAVTYLREAVRSRPLLASGWFNLGRILLAQGRLGDAAQALEHFIEAAGPRHRDQVVWARGVLAELARR